MKKIMFVLLIFILLQNTCNAQEEYDGINEANSAITYELNGGRFGDNLLSYSRAKWLSYIYDIPLQLYPFPYADQLRLYDEEQMLCIKDFKHVVRLSRVGEIQRDSNTLYINHWRTKIKIDWNDVVFIKQLREKIAPRHDMQKVSIPEGYVSVAVHVRNGGGFSVDNPREKERCPLRFVPEQFFIDQIERIAQIYEGQQLYVYIFTDYKKPYKIAQRFSRALNNENIIFDYNKAENGYNLGVLEDFFSMMQFNCLVRPGSHFSRFVERLGDAQLVIYPYSVRQRAGESPEIDVIDIRTRMASGKWKSTKVRILE